MAVAGTEDGETRRQLLQIHSRVAVEIHKSEQIVHVLQQKLLGAAGQRAHTRQLTNAFVEAGAIQTTALHWFVLCWMAHITAEHKSDHTDNCSHKTGHTHGSEPSDG